MGKISRYCYCLINYHDNILSVFYHATSSGGTTVRLNGILAQMALSASSPSNRPDVLAVGEYLAVFIPGDHASVVLVRTVRYKTRTRQLGRSPRPGDRCSSVVTAHARPSIKLKKISPYSTLRHSTSCIIIL